MARRSTSSGTIPGTERLLIAMVPQVGRRCWSAGLECFPQGRYCGFICVHITSAQRGTLPKSMAIFRPLCTCSQSKDSPPFLNQPSPPSGPRYLLQRMCSHLRNEVLGLVDRRFLAWAASVHIRSCGSEYRGQDARSSTRNSAPASLRGV